ncbi:shikimate kinase like 2 [Wolffia australiana]
MTASICSAPCTRLQKPIKTHYLFFRSNPIHCFFLPANSRFPIRRCSALRSSSSSRFGRVSAISRVNHAATPQLTRNYEFSDGGAEVELRLDLAATKAQSFKDILVDADVTSLKVSLLSSASLTTVFDATRLYDRIKPSETIWFVDEEQLVVNLKKYDADLQWPDLLETWESLTSGATKLLKGASIFVVGDSTEINNDVAAVLAHGIGYTPLSTSQILEKYVQQTIDSWVETEGVESVSQGERAVIEGLSSHVRTVVGTLGGRCGAARRADQWQHLYAGFTVWLSQTEAGDEDSAKDEVRQEVQMGQSGYSNADLVVKFAGWEPGCAQDLAQASLSALKQLILSDKQLPEKKSLYIRLGCRGDWPNIKPPGWDPSKP